MHAMEISGAASTKEVKISQAQTRMLENIYNGFQDKVQKKIPFGDFCAEVALFFENIQNLPETKMKEALKEDPVSFLISQSKTHDIDAATEMRKWVYKIEKDRIENFVLLWKALKEKDTLSVEEEKIIEKIERSSFFTMYHNDGKKTIYPSENFCASLSRQPAGTKWQAALSNFFDRMFGKK